jgi:hypothetical protein
MRPVAVAGVLALCLAGSAEAQSRYHLRPCDALARTPEQIRDEQELALRHAPVLRFAPNARYFPTLPFFTAIDGVDNNGDGRTDLADSAEVTLTDKDSPLPVWNLLDQAYIGQLPAGGKRADQEVPPSQQLRFGLDHSAVMYRVCAMERGEVRELFRYLKSDEQAYSRIGVHAPLSETIQDTTAFKVIQYYFYYVKDLGLQGHPEDIEMVFVFVPVDAKKASQFRVVVGSGHSERTPNNVLVLFAPQLGVDRLNDSLSIIVESGGHSSAPDLPTYGQFTPGIDVNWHIYDIWGTRDIQAISGLGFAGRYRPEMTFPRDGKNAIIIFPSNYNASARQMMQVASQPEKGDSATHSYRLLPVLPFIRISQLLEDSSAQVDTIGAILDTLARMIQSQKEGSHDDWAFTGFNSLDTEEQQAAVRWMQAWNQDMLVRWWKPGEKMRPQLRSRKKHQVWEHDGYLRDPTNIFKSHLFRPTANAISSAGDVLKLVTLGATGYPGDAYELYAGMVIPAVPFIFRLPGYSEFQFGVYRPNFWADARSSFSAAWVWENHRNALISWYRKVSFIPLRSEVLGTEAADFGLGIGLSFLPAIQRKSGATDPFNALRIRVGLRLDLDHPEDALRRVGWEIQVQVRQ